MGRVFAHERREPAQRAARTTGPLKAAEANLIRLYSAPGAALPMRFEDLWRKRHGSEIQLFARGLA
jgi:hypothetical protein